MARVFSGFMSESPKNCSSSCSSGTSPVATSTTAQTKGTTQYTRTRTFPMRALAPNAVASTTLKHDRQSIETDSAMANLLYNLRGYIIYLNCAKINPFLKK